LCPVIGVGAESEFVLSNMIKNMVSHGFTWFAAKALPLMEMPKAQRWQKWWNDETSMVK